MTIYRCDKGVNHEIKQQFRGVDGVNREIKEQYRGVSGVNRKVFSSGLTLYNAGNECINITGGWEILSDGLMWAGASYEKTAENLYVHSVGGDYPDRVVSYVTMNAVNLSDINTLYVTAKVVRVDGTAPSSQIRFEFKTQRTKGTADRVLLKQVYYTDSGSAIVTYAIDVSALNGSYYLEFNADAGTGTTSGNATDGYLYKVYGE